MCAVKVVRKIMPKYDKFNPNPFGAHMKILNLAGKNKVVLDVGCSTGQLAKRLKEKGCKVYGIEVDEVRRPWNDPTIVPKAINGRIDDSRCNKPWDWFYPPHK